VADLVTLVAGSPPKVVVYKSTGSTLNVLTEFEAPGAQRLLVADFTGDMNADIGVVRTASGGDWSLKVHRNVGSGVSSTGEEWWNGPINLATGNVYAGDVNTDGKADLVLSDGNEFRVATSPPSCLDLSTLGVCQSLPSFKLGEAQTWLNGQGWDANPDGGVNARMVMGDWNRDGRDDVMALVKDGSGVKVVVLKATSGGAFVSTGQLWANGSASFDSLRPVAFNGNLDGFADLAMLQQTSSGVNEFWLGTVTTGTVSQVPAGMTAFGAPAPGQSWVSGFAF
jgi:hypothetical protein